MTTTDHTAAPSTANLLAVAAYAGGNRLRQLVDVMEMIGDRHGPHPAAYRRGWRMVCQSCRAPRGGAHAWPCPTWIDFARILGLQYSADTFAALGVELPPDLIKPAAAVPAPPAIAIGDTR